MSKHGWYGVDFDGTLASYEEDQFPAVGEPLWPMVIFVQDLLSAGKDVRIVTARADYEEHRKPVKDFCVEHFGRVLPITDRKDFQMLLLFDDRARQIDPDSGYMLRMDDDWCEGYWGRPTTSPPPGWS